MIKKVLFIACFFSFILSMKLSAQQIYKDKFAHTYSIVAKDSKTGDMAVAVQSHWFSVGTLVSWGKSGVGVVATQSFVNPEFGPQGLKLMQDGLSSTETLNTLISQDEGRDYRQLAVLDVNGNAAAYTGKKCIQSASHFIGDNFSVQANMMLNDKVVPAMASSFEENAALPIAERVLKAMEAAQEAGGDIRGKQSAVLLVVGAKPATKVWMDKKIDLRVDDSENPLVELRRLLKVHRAYEFMNRGDIAVEKGDMEQALMDYGAAEKLFPENLEMKYWKAVALANNSRLEEALTIFKEVFTADENWRELTKRLPKSGLLTLTPEELKRIQRL
jgi:uncharacterized Ntn-hydrolase superfamily protein